MGAISLAARISTRFSAGYWHRLVYHASRMTEMALLLIQRRRFVAARRHFRDATHSHTFFSASFQGAMSDMLHIDAIARTIAGNATRQPLPRDTSAIPVTLMGLAITASRACSAHDDDVKLPRSF